MRGMWSSGRLKELLHSIKSYSAHAINKAERERGVVWEKERFDRYIRSEPDLIEKFNYILRSPWDSGLARAERRLSVGVGAGR